MGKLFYPTLIMVVFLGLTVTGGAVLAQSQLIVTSAEQKIDYGERIITYTGNVQAKREGFTLRAEEVEVYLTEGNTPDKILARGGVNFIDKSGKRQASCDTAIYTVVEETVTLQGNVHYQDELGNDLTAQQIIVWLLEEKLKATGNPVSATLVSWGEEKSDSTGGESK